MVLSSPEPEAEAGAIAAGGFGATAALTRNPADVRKIAANNKNSMVFASPVLVTRADARAGIRATHLVIHTLLRHGRCQQLRGTGNLSLPLAVQMTYVKLSVQRDAPRQKSTERAIR